MLGEAIQGLQQALEVLTRDHIPQQWAAAQATLGSVLIEQATRQSGEESPRMFGGGSIEDWPCFGSVRPRTLSVVVGGDAGMERVRTPRTGEPPRWSRGQDLLGQAEAAFAAGVRSVSPPVSAGRVGGDATQSGPCVYRAGPLADWGGWGTWRWRRRSPRISSAMEIRTREHMPNFWAETQTALGTALVAQARHMDRDPAERLLNEAIAGYRQVLQVYHREYQPQPWATALTGLGEALVEQGRWQGGEQGTRSFAEAVEALQRALEVRTREHLPQPWAMTQHHLGAALAAQGAQAGGESRSAVVGECGTRRISAPWKCGPRERLPGPWAETHQKLGEAYVALGDWSNAATGYANVLQVSPDDERVL